MKGGLDRLIARVAQGRQDVRPLAPTMFEDDGVAGNWAGEQAGEMAAEASGSVQSSTATGRREAQPVRSAPATPLPLAKADRVEQRPRSRDLAPRPERHATMDLSPVDELPTRPWPAERETRPEPSFASPPTGWEPAPQVPPRQQQQPALVETVENNSIVIEIGRIEVKAPPVAPPSSPSAFWSIAMNVTGFASSTHFSYSLGLIPSAPYTSESVAARPSFCSTSLMVFLSLRERARARRGHQSIRRSSSRIAPRMRIAA